ncbi:hypothetical protein HanPSC8_Chr17g0752351 [Helianthus annuus]|nr:hypothetical protein HanPSC8_Chr17g0752351 [Helianthus annuus]
MKYQSIQDSAMQAWRSSSLDIGRRLPSVSLYWTRKFWGFNFKNLFFTSLCRSVSLAERGRVNLIKSSSYSTFIVFPIYVEFKPSSCKELQHNIDKFKT